MQSSKVPRWHCASEVLGWQSATKVQKWHSAECHLGTLHQMLQNRKVWPGESISLRTFTPMVPKVFLQDFLPTLGTSQPKITNRSFWPSWDQMVLLTGVRPKPGFGPFKVRPWIKFLKFCLEKLRTLRQWFRKFPSRIFYPFWAFHGQKLRICLFDRRATKWCFWPACDQERS